MERLDMFKTNVKLFYKSDEFGSRLGARTTLIMLILLGLVFYPSISDFFSFTNFKVDFQEIYQTPERLTSWEKDQFNMAVQLQNYNGSKRAYDVYFTKNQVLLDDRGKIIANITERHLGVECDMNVWKKYGQKVYSSFKYYLAMNGSIMCGPPEFNMSIYGRYSANSSMLVVSVERCRQEDPDCLTDQQIQDENIATLLPSLFYPQTTFQYSKPEPINFFLQEDIFCSIRLSHARPVQLGYEILISDVIIDDSNVDIWPSSIPFFHKNMTRRGFQIDRLDYTNQVLNNETLFRWRLRKSSKTLYVTRTIDKIDDVCSYIGGVLGVVLLIGQLIRHYNQKLLLLRLGNKISFSAMGKPEQVHKEFSFLSYIKYMTTLVLWGTEVNRPNLSETSHVEKVCFIIDHMEKVLSIDNILERLRKCQILLDALAGNDSFKLLSFCLEEEADQLRQEELYDEQLAEQLEGQLQRKQQAEGETHLRLPRRNLDDVRKTVLNKLGKRFRHRVNFDNIIQQRESNQNEQGQIASLFKFLN